MLVFLSANAVLPAVEFSQLQEPRTKMSLGASISSAGPGVSFTVSLNNSLLIKLGAEYLAFQYPFTFEENDINYAADLSFRTGNVSLTGDYYYYRALFISAGAGFNFFQPDVAGAAAADWKYGDIFIPAADIGEFNFNIQPTWRVSPYLGAGIGRKFSRKGRVSFSAEAGAFYMGPPKVEIEASGLLAPTASEEHKHKERLEAQFSAWRLYPVIRMGLSFLLTK